MTVLLIISCLSKQLCLAITEHLKSRLAWSDLQIVHDVIFVLATQGWEKILSTEERPAGESSTSPMEAVTRLGLRFKDPLESNGVDLANLILEFSDMVAYANQFISLATMDYQSVWWRLFHASNAASWSNILQLVQLLFTLPVSNGKLERVFSTLKLIKVDKRSSMSNDLLDDLIMINTDPVPIKQFNPDQSIGLWWKDNKRRPNQNPRKGDAESVPGPSGSAVLADMSGQSSDEDTDEVLQQWDDWTGTTS